jgi:hypothetical protein
VDPFVNVECSQTRAGRIETAYQGVPAFTHRTGSCKRPAVIEAVGCGTYTAGHSFRLARRAAQHNLSPPLLKAESWIRSPDLPARSGSLYRLCYPGSPPFNILTAMSV